MEADESAWTGLLDTVVSTLTEGVTVVDETGRFLITNPAAKRYMGYTDATMPEYREKIVALTLEGEEIAVEDRPTSRALRGETVLEVPVIHRGPTGDRVIVVSSLPLEPDSETGAARCLSIFRDITQEYAARAELTAFANVVAHDLRSPLTTIKGWAELAEAELSDTGSLTPELAGELIGRMRKEVDRMSVLIEDLHVHAISRDHTLEFEEVDLGALVEEVVEAYDAREQVVVGDLPRLRADRVLLRQALDNVVGNALKFVAPGTVAELRISAEVTASDVRLRFSDSGIGVPDGAHGDIFGEFRRLDSGYPGTGLGLAIVKRVVERHDGTVTARPNPDGAGTLVEFVLPGAAVIR